MQIPWSRKLLLRSGIALASLLFLWGIKSLIWPSTNAEEDIVVLTEVQPRSFQVEVHTVGELEAARSTIIASSIRGDLGKIIYLVADGQTIQAKETLVKMDPSPFEEKIADLKSRIQDQKAIFEAHTQTFNWEVNQAQLESKTAAYDVATAQLELSKAVKGDGPMELFRLQSSVQKALAKFEELNSYAEDLVEMEKAGYINEAERKQAEKKLQEEKEAYENAKLQFDTFKNLVHPMVVKKAQAALKRAQIRVDEVTKAGKYKIEKARTALRQAEQVERDLKVQLQAALQELEDSEIRAPANGMVVLREEYRTGQKRKPRVGDILVKNQPILDLPELDSMIVKTKVREVDLYKVQLGKTATIEVDAYPQTFFKGTVQSIGVLALADLGRSSSEKYFEIKLAMANTDNRLRPGMTARVTILADSVDNALTVPVPAIFEKNKRLCCYVATRKGYRLVPIKTGASNEQWVQIAEGLQTGDKVALTLPSPERIYED